MKQLIKYLILSAICMNYAPTASSSPEAIIAYKFFDDEVSRAAGLVPQSYKPSPSTEKQTKKFGFYFEGTRTGKEIINCMIDKLDLDEFMILCLCINGQHINLDRQFTLEQLQSSEVEVNYDPAENTNDKLKQRRIEWLANQSSEVDVDYNPAENTKDKLKQRRIEWLANQINQSVWHRAEAEKFVKENHADSEGNLRPLKTLHELWSQRKK